MTQVGPDPVARLRLVASSIAGRMLEVRAAAAGESAWTDGRTVYVDAAADRRWQLQAVAVQASLIGAGSLEPEVVRRLVGRPALAGRYLGIEVPRAMAAVEDRLPPAASALLATNIGADDRTPLDSLALALAGSGSADLPDVFGAIRPKALLAHEATPPDGSASTVVDERRSRPSETRLDDVDEPAGDEAATVDFFTDRAGGGGALGWLLQRMLRFQRHSGSGALGADVPPRGHRVGGTPGRGAGAYASGVREAVASVATQGDWVYPEWDVRRQAYRHDWCNVREEEPPADGAMPRRGREVSLRRPLSRLGLGRQVVHRRAQGEDVDIDAVIEARVDVLAGLEPPDTVYLESLRRRHDLAVVVLLDVSGSAKEPSATHGSVHDQQLAAAMALVESLHALGNRVAVYGFYSRGRSAVRVVRVKRFDDGMDLRVLRRLGGLEPGGFTRLGAAIRHGTDLVEDGGGSRRLLIVLSDGLAYDHGYEGRYGEADARRALTEARRRGTGCLCLSVGAVTDLAALRRVFGSAAHATVRQSDELVQIVGPLFRDALASAELLRESTQRDRQARRRLDHNRRSA